jgi:hypothetical protein
MLTNFIIFQNYIKQTKELLYKTQKVIIHVSTAMKNLKTICVVDNCNKFTYSPIQQVNQ